MSESALIADWFQEHGFAVTDVVVEDHARIHIVEVEIGGACHLNLAARDSMATATLSLLHYPRGTKRGDVASLQRVDRVARRWMIVAVDLHASSGIPDEATVTLRRVYGV